MMVKQPERRTDRCFLPVGSNNVTLVQFPAQRQPTSSLQLPAQVRLRGSSGEDGETDAKRMRLYGSDEASTIGESPSESRDQTGSDSGSLEDEVSPADGVQQVALESSEDNRAAELASAGGLKVTIQRSSESRAFGEKEPSSDQPTCHVCHCTCPTAQAFELHMSGAEHHRRLLHITQSAAAAQHTGGRQGAVERWCDVCQSSFTGDIILHRRCKEHKESKKSSRPFCSVCRRHFRTPRKFVEHMKSREHKQQVKLEEAQDEEMITVDAVGCFESESKTREGRQRRNAPGLKGDEGGDAQGLEETGEGDEEEGDTPEQTGVEGGDARGDMGEDAPGQNKDKGGDKDVGQKETGRGHVEERTQRDVSWPEAEEEDEKEGKLGRIGDKETERGDSEDGGDAEELMEEVQTEEFSPHTAHGDLYVVPVSGFFCRLCHRFFFRERTRDEHCGSQEHLSRVLQSETHSRVSPSSEDSA